MSESAIKDYDCVFIPESMRKIRNWCAWKLEKRKGKWTKVPYQRKGKKASSKEVGTWNTLDNVAKMLKNDEENEFNGFGFMLSDGFVFIDVDHCVSCGSIDERGKDVLSAFPMSYAEISQSGRGLHILTKGIIPRGFNNRRTGVEMYSFGRFCAYTGNAIQALEPTEEQDGLDYCFNKYSTHTGNTIGTYTKPIETGISTHSDRWIISHAENVEGQKGRNFRALFSGDTSAYESASEADSALCTLLAFWCDRDQGQIDRIFRQSGLYRPKWEREDYRIRTIQHCCQRIPESLSEYQRRMNREKARAIAEQLY